MKNSRIADIQILVEVEEEIEDVLPILKPKQIQNMAANADAQTLQTFLPFLDEDDVAELAREAKENGQQFTMYLPFMDEDVIAEWAREDRKSGRNIAMYLTFMDEDDVKDLLMMVMKNKK